MSFNKVLLALFPLALVFCPTASATENQIPAAPEFMPIEVPVTITDLSQGAAKNKKIRFDYVLYNTSDGRPVEVRTLEFTMAEYGGGKTITAPGGMFIGEYVHLQVRCYSGSWRNHAIGTFKLSRGQNHINVTLAGGLSSNQKVIVYESKPDFNRGVGTEEWIASQNDLIRNEGRTVVHHRVTSGTFSRGTSAGSRDAGRGTSTETPTVPSYNNSNFDPRFTVSEITDPNEARHSLAQRPKAPVSSLSKVKSIIVSQFRKSEASETEVTIYADIYDSKGNWKSQIITSKTFYSSLDRIHLTPEWNSDDLVYSMPFIRIRTRARNESSWTQICDTPFDLSSLQGGLRAARIILAGDITTTGKVVIVKVPSRISCILPLDPNLYTEGGTVSADEGSISDFNHTTSYERTAGTGAPKILRKEEASYANQMLLYLRDVAPRGTDLRVTAFVDFYDRNTMSYLSSEQYSITLKGKNPGYTFYLASEDEFVYNKPRIRIEMRSPGSDQWKVLTDRNFFLITKYDVVVLCFSLKDGKLDILNPGTEDHDLVVPI